MMRKIFVLVMVGAAALIAGKIEPPNEKDVDKLLDFIVKNQRVVGEKHLKLCLVKNGKLIDAILFGHNETLPERIHAVYSLSVNEYNGAQGLQLIVRHWQHLET